MWVVHVTGWPLIQNGRGGANEVLPLQRGGGAEKVLAMLMCVCVCGGGGALDNC